MADLIAELETRFDVVLIDSAPVLPVTDATVLAATTKGTILVAQAGRSRKDQLRRAASLLEVVDARVLGIVLNRVTQHGIDPYVGYYRPRPLRRATDRAEIPAPTS
jgi:Mrp family chromosome partitioning ATPase